MESTTIDEVLSEFPWIEIPEGMREDLDENEELAYVNECGYTFMQLYKYIPNGMGGISFLGCCLVHDWRRGQLQPDDLKGKAQGDIEFLNNLLNTINQHEIGETERAALSEIAFLYFQSVSLDRVVEGKSVFVKIWNVMKVLGLVMAYPIKSLIRTVRLRVFGVAKEK